MVPRRMEGGSQPQPQPQPQRQAVTNSICRPQVPQNLPRAASTSVYQTANLPTQQAVWSGWQQSGLQQYQDQPQAQTSTEDGYTVSNTLIMQSSF